MTVFDALDAGRDRLSDRPRNVCVHGHIGAPIFGRFNRGANLRLGVLGRFDRIVWRGDATARHQLDLACALSQLLSRPQAHLIGAVSNRCDAHDLGVAQRAARHARNLKGESKIPMSRGLRDEGARGIDARTNHDTFVNGALEPEHRTTKVAHSGETSHQCRLSLSRSQEMKV